MSQETLKKKNKTKSLKDKKWPANLCGIICGLSIIIATVVISVQINIADNDVFVKEYVKTGVDKDLGMDINDVAFVSQEMMKYLFGQREELSVITTMFGKERDFFNDRERAHMVDVKALLDNVILVRNICFGLIILSIIGLLYLKGKMVGLYYFCKGYLISVAIAIAAIGSVGLFILSSGFTEFWNRFHGVFFTNDLWLLDYNTDMMIRLLPESFFSTLVTNCVISFVIIVGVLAVLAFIIVQTLKTSRFRLKNRL